MFSPSPRQPLRHRVRAALELVVEFATLGEYGIGPEGLAPAGAPAPAEHPHRRPLTPAPRHRAGSVPAAPAVCRTPLAPRARRTPAERSLPR